MNEVSHGTMRGREATALPPTSLVLCSRNRPSMLVDLVVSILAGEETPTELIIIDDSDAENEQLTALTTNRPCEIRYVWNRSRGLSRANNTGIGLARHDLLVFTQDDMLVTPTWFGVLVRALLEAGPRVVVGGQVLAGEPENQSGFAPSTVAEERPLVFEGRLSRDVLYFQNVAFHRSVIGDIGGFDPNLGPGTAFPSAEDNEFAYRLLQAGYRIQYEPRAVTYHRAWRSDSDYLQLEWNYGRGQGAFYAKHLSIRDPYILRRLVGETIGHLARLPLKLVFDRRQMRGSIVFVAGMYTAVAEWLLRRSGYGDNVTQLPS